MGDENDFQFQRDLQEFELREDVKKDMDITRWQLDLENLFEEIEHDLRGERRNPETGVWEKIKGTYFDKNLGRDVEISDKPLVNDYGIRNIITTLRSLANKNTFLSNLDEDDIERNMILIDYAITNHLVMGVVTYGIEKRNLGIIKERIVMPVYF